MGRRIGVFHWKRADQLLLWRLCVPADGVGNRLQIGVGRGAAAVIMVSGALLGVMALAIYPIKAVRELERSAA